MTVSAFYKVKLNQVRQNIICDFISLTQSEYVDRPPCGYIYRLYLVIPENFKKGETMIGFILALLYWFIKLIVYLIDNKKWGWLLIVFIVITILYIAVKQ